MDGTHGPYYVKNADLTTEDPSTFKQTIVDSSTDKDNKWTDKITLTIKIDKRWGDVNISCDREGVRNPYIIYSTEQKEDGDYRVGEYTILKNGIYTIGISGYERRKGRASYLFCR